MNKQPYSIGNFKVGITRLRVKGGASADSLYALDNAYVSAARTVVPRQGSAIHARLPQGTMGLALFNGVFQVFADHRIEGIPDGFNLNVLRHPDDEDAELVRIWKAEPLMNSLYVVAEWSDDPDRAFHYWMQPAPTWQPNTVYNVSDRVSPSIHSGFTYTPQRLGEPGTLWAPGVERAVGDVIEPTTFNGYAYVVVEAIGIPPRSGSVEPTWATTPGAAVIEQTDVAPKPGAPQAPPPPSGPPPGYRNPGGSMPRDLPGGGDYYEQIR